MSRRIILISPSSSRNNIQPTSIECHIVRSIYLWTIWQIISLFARYEFPKNALLTCYFPHITILHSVFFSLLGVKWTRQGSTHFPEMKINYIVMYACRIILIFGLSINTIAIEHHICHFHFTCFFPDVVCLFKLMLLQIKNNNTKIH